MGQAQGKLPLPSAGSSQSQAQAPPPCAACRTASEVQASTSTSSPATLDGCPVGDVSFTSNATSSSSSSSNLKTSSAVYNVYNERIDSAAGQSVREEEERLQKSSNFNSIWSLGWVLGSDTLSAKNNMPVEANQQPSAGQRKPLSTSRESSSIPKGGTAFTWQYPSPQMFFNALARKGKADGVDEDDMENVVFFHNGMNEVTWNHVRRWELLHASECNAPKLARFRGRPHELSPLARLRSWFSGDLPFDRHDWYVDRCGQEVRYVIDFYFDEEKAGSMEAFEVVARPALDSVTSCVDRVKMNVYITCAKYGLPCPFSGHAPTMSATKTGS